MPSRRAAEHGFTSLKRSAEHGFTLVELIVAMSIGSVLLVALSWSVASLGRELGSARRAEASQALRSALPVIRRLIAQARPVEKGQPAIEASSTRYAFISAPPAALGAAGLVRMTLSIERGKDMSLRAVIEPLDTGATLPELARAPVVLVNGLADARFDYEMSPEADLPPRLVTLSMTDRTGRETRLAVASVISGRGACRFDPISMTCRR